MGSEGLLELLLSDASWQIAHVDGLHLRLAGVGRVLVLVVREADLQLPVLEPAAPHQRVQPNFLLPLPAPRAPPL